MTRFALHLSEMLPPRSSRDIPKLHLACKRAGIAVSSDGYLVFDSEGDARLQADAIRRRWDLAQSFRAAAYARFPTRTGPLYRAARKAIPSILRGDLEGGPVSIVTWIRRRCSKAKSGMFVFLKEFLQQRNLLPDILPDYVSGRAMQIQRGIAQARWDGLSEANQQAIRGFLQYVCAHRSESTARFYRYAIGHLVRLVRDHNIGSLEVVRPEHISSLVRSLSERRLTKASQIHYLRALKQLFQWLIDERGYPKSPIFRRHFPRISKNGTSPLSPQEMLQIRSTLDSQFVGSMSRALFYLIYLTGLRPMEAISVRHHEIDRMRLDLFVARGKGRKSSTLPIANYAIEGIDEWLEISPLPKGCEHVFHHKGLQISAEKATEVRREISRASGVSFTWRQLRTTFATRMAEYGVSPFIIKELLRHSRLNSIMDYIKMSDPSVREGYAKFAEEVTTEKPESKPKRLGTAAALIRTVS